MREQQTPMSELPKGWAWTDLQKLAASRGRAVTPAEAPNQQFELYSVPSYERNAPDIVPGSSIGSSKQTKNEDTILPCRINPRINRVWRVKSHSSLPEQRRIVAKIEELFTKLGAGVEALKKAKALLKRYRQSVLKAAFEGKLIGDSHIDPDSRRPDWMEYAPASWKHMQVSDIIERAQYGTSVKANKNPSGIAVLRMGNIQEGGLSFEDLKYLPRSVPDLQKYMLADGDVLFNRTNSAELVGKTAVYHGHHPKAAFASYLIRLTVDRNLCNPDFLSFYINSCHDRAYIRSVQSQQVGQANVNTSKLRAMPIPVPPLDEQESIVEEIQRRGSVAGALESTTEKALSQAGALRQSILKRAFEGRLVSQCSDDEQAERLLERTRSSKWGEVA